MCAVLSNELQVEVETNEKKFFFIAAIQNRNKIKSVTSKSGKKEENVTSLGFMKNALSTAAATVFA